MLYCGDIERTIIFKCGCPNNARGLFGIAKIYLSLQRNTKT